MERPTGTSRAAGIEGEIPAELARKQLGKHGGDRKSEERNQDANRQVDIKYGSNNAEYLIARIARDQKERELRYVKMGGNLLAP